jgi:hypothetical protein
MNKYYFLFSVFSTLIIFKGNAQNIAVNTSGTAAASTNMFEVTQTSTAANMVAIYAIHSGATAGTGYGLYSTKTGASTTNIGGYFNASGATNNYALIVPSGGGSVGIGTTAPASTLDVQGSLGFKTTSISGATTLDQTHNVVLATAGAGGFTITLPAAASNTGKTYYIKKIDNAAGLITIDGNASETIDGATTLVLYVQYDAVRIVCDGSNWYVINDELKPHNCKLTRAAAQSINSSTWTSIAFDGEDYDIGSIGDYTTNDRIDIRRAGKYMVIAFSRMAAGIDDQEYLVGEVRKNGSAVMDPVSYTSAASINETPSILISTVLDCAAGDYIDFMLWHNEGAAVNTSTNTFHRPTLSVYEIR